MSYLSPSPVGWQFWKLIVDVICNVVHKPLEALTVVILLELQLFADVANWISAYNWLSSVEIFTEFFIQPNFHHSHVILKISSSLVCWKKKNNNIQTTKQINHSKKKIIWIVIYNMSFYLWIGLQNNENRKVGWNAGLLTIAGTCNTIFWSTPGLWEELWELWVLSKGGSSFCINSIPAWSKLTQMR